EKPGFFSKDAPLSGEENEVVAIRAQVASIVTDDEFGRFGLQASQVPPFTVLVPLAMLQQRLAFADRANLLLRPTTDDPAADWVGGASLHIGSYSYEVPQWMSARMHSALVSRVDSFRSEFQAEWQPADASLEIRKVSATGGHELRSPGVFIVPQIVATAPRGVDALTYLVNDIRAGEKSVPYSMVTALDAPSSGFLPAELDDDEIVINQWLADDLGIGLNEQVKLTYFVMGERRQLTEQTREFQVIQILPMNEPQLNSSWMPDFPGLSDKKSCRDWQPGFAMDTSRIRDQDEAYWQTYRGTPKAFVNITVGQQMWGNRWGNVTAIRYPATVTEEALAAELKTKLTPEMVGLSFLPLREQALAATKAPVDFGQLFVSFSFFLIAAAAVLTGLLFVFSLEQRNAEAGLLLALGLRPKQVRRLFLAEGLVLAIVGSVLGAFGAVLYTKLVLRALATVWQGAVGAVEFEFGANPLTIPGGVVAGVLVALIAMWLASRRQLRHSARELLTGEVTEPTAKVGRGFFNRRGAEEMESAAEGRPVKHPSADLSHASASSAVESAPRLFGRGPFWLAGACVVIAAALLLFLQGAGVFFGAGALLLISGLALALGGLRALATGGRGGISDPGNKSGGLSNVGQLGTRNAARRRGRSLATIAVLASGVFMVVAVDSFRKTPPREGETGDPGTGGFALVGESALPIYEDLNTEKGREAYGLNDSTMRDVRVVPLRVREGDDASCLNLNRALQPRLLGVKPEELGNAFLRKANDDTWQRLAAAAADGAVPGIVDANTLQWALQKKVGDTLEYRDDRGAPFLVRIAGTVTGSMLQGNIVIAEQRFVEKFPGAGGYRYFLINAPTDRAAAVRNELSRALTDRGLEVVSTAQRLAEFQAVENTYLSIFQALGGLGLLLGTAGLAIVVARNVLERRREFGLLAAVGFRPGQLRQLVFAEHRWLIVAALLIG
ncbi:MAG: FtsX-like permease family protein, partial [Chthoniobacter sp.]|nr:FtsX-like permease family protein [Chthoniobacter sp.]